MARRAHIWAIAGYTVLTAAVLWPAVARFTSQPMASPADGSVFRWAWWSMPRAIAEGRNPFVTEDVFHPLGADLAVTTSAPLVSAISWPVRAVFGDAAQVNAAQLGAMLLAGLGAYLLAHHVCGDRRSAALAGIAFALLPHRFVDVSLGHLNLIHTGVLPLAMLALLRLLEHPAPRRAVVFGGIAGATFLIEPQLVVLLMFAAVPLCLTRREQLGAAFRSLLLAGGVALIVAAPLLVPMAAALVAGEAGAPAPTRDSLIYSSSPLSWIVPPFDELWIGHLASVGPLTRTLEGIAYPGLIVLGLAVAGRRWPAVGDERRGWAAVSAVGIVLSLGPYPFVRDTYVELPMPFFLVRAIPALESMRVPGRFAIVGSLGLVVLAASTLAAVARRHPRRANALVAVVCCVTAVELLPRSLPESPQDVAEPYYVIARDPGQGAVLEIPIQWSTGDEAVGFGVGRSRDFLFLVNATVHERATVSGAASRYAEERFAQLKDIDLYRQVLALQGEPGFDDPATFDSADLYAAGVGFVAYDRDEPAPRVLSYLQRLGLPVLADDGTVIVWKVDG